MATIEPSSVRCEKRQEYLTRRSITLNQYFESLA